MTKFEFLSEIKKELGFLPQNDIDEAVRYFDSYFAGSESDEDVIARLGNPKDAAKTYYSANLLPKLGGQNTGEPPVQKRRGSVWLIVILLIVLSPILIPLAIALGCLILTFIAVIIGIYFALLFGGISIWFGGAAIVIKGVVSGLGFANIMLECGIGFLMFGLGLALTLLAVFIAVKLVPWFIKKIVNFGSKRVRRRNA